MSGILSSQAIQDRDAAMLACLETPCYVFDPAAVAQDLSDLRDLLGTPVVTSVKASPVLDLLVRCNQHFSDGIEIASLGELNLTIGRMSVPRFVNTPAMDSTLIAAALACRATLVADSPQHIALIEKALQKPSPQRQERAPEGIVLRVNAASLLNSSGPSADHFGMDLATVHREMARLQDGTTGVKVVGLHVFAGSHSFAHSGLDITHQLAGLVASLRQRHGAALEMVLIGAGLGADWRDAKLDFAAYRNSLHDLQGQVRVMHEAGRAVFSRCGTFATRIMAVKELNDAPILVCDGGMAHCFALAQTEHFVKRWREPALMKSGTLPTPKDTASRTYRVVGNSCSRADILGSLSSDQAPEPGDMLLFSHCGAYHSYSPTGFLNLRQARRYIAS